MIRALLTLVITVLRSALALFRSRKSQAIVVPTVRFQLLYVWFVIDHGRRRVLHFNVTAHPTAAWVMQQLRSPWQNGTAERFVGSVRRELLDHVVVLDEDHLRRLLREYVRYDNSERVHTSIGDAPEVA